MTFLAAVRTLRHALDVPQELTLPQAIHKMTKIMGLPLEGEDGDELDLPRQVEALLEATGITIPDDQEQGREQVPKRPLQVDVDAPEKKTKIVLKQRASLRNRCVDGCVEMIF